MKKSFLALFFLLSVLNSWSIDDQTDSLVILTSKNEHDTVRANAYIQLSLVLYGSYFDTLFALNKLAFEISTKNLSKEIGAQERRAFLKLQSESNGNIGYYYMAMGEFEIAMEHFSFSAQSDLIRKDYEGLAATLNNVGMIYNYKGNIEKSLKYSLASIKIDEALGNFEELGAPLNNVAYIYEHQGDSVMALKYYRKALSIFKESNDGYGEAAILLNIGSIYKAQNKDSALWYLNKGYQIAEKEEIINLQATALLNTSDFYFKNENIDSSTSYLMRCLPLFEECKDFDGVSVTYINMAKIYLIRGEADLAKDYGEKGLLLAQKSGNVYNIQAGSKVLSEVQQKLGDFEKSLDYFQVYITMRDSLNNSKTEKTVLEQGLKYEFEKKEAETIFEHEKELAVNETEKKRQKVITWSVTIGLIFIIFFALIIFHRLRISNRQKNIIHQKNEENELLLGEIHHRVKNNLQVISSLLSLQEKSISDETAKRAIMDGKERVKSMGLIHKMLYQNDGFSGIEMNDYVPKLVFGLMSSFGFQDEDMELGLSFDDIKLDVDSAIPIGLIINELVINSFKYAFEGIDQPTLSVGLKKIDGQMELRVADNGNGSVEAVSSSESFGYKLVKALVRQLDGQLHIEQNAGLHYRIMIKDFKIV